MRTTVSKTCTVTGKYYKIQGRNSTSGAVKELIWYLSIYAVYFSEVYITNNYLIVPST